MSDSAPDASSQRSWDEVHEQTTAYVASATQHLQEFYEDESRDSDARMLALLSVRALICLDMTLLHVGALERRLVETKTLMRDFMQRVLQVMDLDEKLRADLEKRLEQVEYATVAEGQLERYVEQLTGDVGERLAGRLKGDENS